MSSSVDQSLDTRSPELAKAHSVMAREAHRAMTASALELAEKSPGEASDLRKNYPSASEKYEYQAGVALGGALFAFNVDMLFTTAPYYFVGWGFGQGGGGILSYGAAWFNYRLEDIVGWQARFQASFAPIVSEINFWGMQGEYIGVFVGGGIGFGASFAFGGQGDFRSK